MKWRGREVCRGLGDLGNPTAAMSRPGPSDPVWTTRSRFIVGDFAAARKRDRPRLSQWGPEGLAGRPGGHRRSLHPGTEFFRPLPSSSARWVDINPAGLRRSGSANAHPASCSRPSLPTASRWTLGGDRKCLHIVTNDRRAPALLELPSRLPPGPLRRQPWKQKTPVCGGFPSGPARIRTWVPRIMSPLL